MKLLLFFQSSTVVALVFFARAAGERVGVGVVALEELDPASHLSFGRRIREDPLEQGVVGSQIEAPTAHIGAVVFDLPPPNNGL